MVFDTCSAISGLIITNVRTHTHTRAAHIGSPLRPQICVLAIVAYTIVCVVNSHLLICAWVCLLPFATVAVADAAVNCFDMCVCTCG